MPSTPREYTHTEKFRKAILPVEDYDARAWLAVIAARAADRTRVSVLRVAQVKGKLNWCVHDVRESEWMIAK
jgi:hypothetical protein